MKYTIEYYDRKSQKIIYKEYKNKKSFIKRLTQISTGDVYMITIDGKECHKWNYYPI